MPIFPAGRRTPSPASLVDRPVPTACGCGRSRTWAAFTTIVVPLNRTTSWLQVELAGFARRKAQRNVSRSGGLPALLAPPPGVTAHSIVTAIIAATAQFFEDPDQRQLFTSRFSRVHRQQPVELRCPSPQPWPRLHQTLVLENPCRGDAHHLLQCVEGLNGIAVAARARAFVP